MSSFADSAPPVLTDIEATQRFVRQLDRSSDLIETACSAAALTTLALDVHLEREGKDTHAQAMLETAHWLQLRLAELVDMWHAIEE